jgi:RNA-splicing ligase RtcB
MTENVEESCLKQINDMINHPAFTNPVVIMPDTHAGKGCVIGFTMLRDHKIIPNTIGVDIGCGVLAVKLNIKEIKDFEAFDNHVRQQVPLGFNYHKYPLKLEKVDPELNMKVLYICNKIGLDYQKVCQSIGTLGGGNHFIEVGRSTVTGDLWLTIHSGSRNLGCKVAQYHQKKANSNFNEGKGVTLREYISTLKEEGVDGPQLGAMINEYKENDKKQFADDLDYLEGQEADEYIYDMIIAQQFAALNRYCMAANIFPEEQTTFKIDSVHNFISEEDGMIRKGATSARLGEKLVIPLNMRDGTLICIGKGNAAWNNSAPHGAGRAMSRNTARKTLDVEKFKKQMSDANIFSTSVHAGTIDESPDAYKDGTEIEKLIEPTCVIVDRIIPIYSLKSGDDVE